jgi:hypothetical protein
VLEKGLRKRMNALGFDVGVDIHMARDGFFKRIFVGGSGWEWAFGMDSGAIVWSWFVRHLFRLDTRDREKTSFIARNECAGGRNGNTQRPMDSGDG